MANIILFYKLKAHVTQQQFEGWLRTTDFPAMRALKTVKSFVAYRVIKRAMDAAPPSAHYVEIFDVPDLAAFVSQDLAAEGTQKIMAQFRSFVEEPEYLIAEPVSEKS
jgi:REDY-like protein HapK